MLVPTVPPCYQALRRKLDQSGNIDARFCFFLPALFTAADQIRRHLNAGTPVVVESYFACCLSTHRVFGGRASSNPRNWAAWRWLSCPNSPTCFTPGVSRWYWTVPRRKGAPGLSEQAGRR